MKWKEDQLEHVLCDLCQTYSDVPFHIRADGMKVVQCPECGLVYLNPRPKAEFIHALYQQDYFQSTSTEGIGYPTYLEKATQRFIRYASRQRLRLVSSYVKFRGAECLEIGCATGELCYLATKLGAKALGIDISKEAIAIAQQRYPRLDFRVAAIEELPKAQKFDIIFALELIEHTVSPTSFMKEVSTRLKNGGTVVLSTPNLDCGRRVGLHQWIGFTTSFEHLYFFDPDILNAVAKTADLTIYEWYSSGGDGIARSDKPVSRYPRVKRILRLLGLYHPINKLRNALARPKIVYERHGQQHNLMAILVRAQEP